MTTVVGVRFEPVGKIYYFQTQDETIRADEDVIVETSRGLEFAHVVIGTREIEEEKKDLELKPVIRRATSEDIENYNINKQRQRHAFDVCKEKIEELGLPMKLISVVYTIDSSKIIFSFSSDERVDFRNLVKELASIFRARIELRQIGARDEAKKLSGLASCGRECCCASWKGGFDVVSIKMAKNQDLSLNPSKISGICGRLMCCLKYEDDTYIKLRETLPKVGDDVKINGEVAEVQSLNLFKQKVKLKTVNPSDESTKIEWFDVGEIND